MKVRLKSLSCVFIVTLIISPALVLAAPPSTSPYYTDSVNSYVQDQVSKDMEELNKFLCFVGATAPNLLVNNEDYIAMVNQKICAPDTSSGGGSFSTNNPFIPLQVKSTRASSTTPMLTKIWLDDFSDTPEGTSANGRGTPTKISVPLYISASQAPSKSLPFGIFRLDFCKLLPTDTTCDKQIGYIDSTRDGLAFYTLKLSGPYSEYFEEFALQLSANSSTDTGSGIVIKANNLITGTNLNGDIVTTATVFSHSPDYFYRDTGGNPQCFRRTGIFSEESVWRYGLYNAATGERLKHVTSFPVEYLYTSNNLSNTGATGKTYNGYLYAGYLSMPVEVPSGETLSQINYDTFPPVKTNFTLLRSSGSLYKFTTTFLKLNDIHKAPFEFYATANITDPGNVNNVLTSGNWYQIYWNNIQNQFYKYSTRSTLTYRYIKETTPVAIGNTSMATVASAATSDLYGYPASLPGGFTIQLVDYKNFGTNLGNTRLIQRSYYEIVYPTELQAINDAGGLQCINNCPTAAALAADTFVAKPFNQTYSTLVNRTYSVNKTTGNLQDGPPVGSAPSSPSGSSVKQDNQKYTDTGRLITKTDMDKIKVLKPTCSFVFFGVTYTTCQESDVDLLAYVTNSTGYTYYVWSTSPYSYNQAAFLLDAQQQPVKLYPPLDVTFNVPDSTKYGSAAGTIVGLQYYSFGDLWGIDYKCIDITSNKDCIFTGGSTTLPENTRYIPSYSIPFDSNGVVTASVSLGSIVKGTQYLVKGLEKEVRLAPVPIGLCTVLGLDQPIKTKKLPSASEWNNALINIGTKPALSPPPAPRVIHGVKQY